MSDEKAVRKIRIAYMMGWQREYFQLDFDREHSGGEPSEKGAGFGDYMMFMYTPEEHAHCLNCPEIETDPFETGEITAEDITSILKTVYGKDYKEMAACAAKDRKEFEQEKQQKKKRRKKTK